MDIGSTAIYEIKKKMLVKYPRFGSEVAQANIEFRNDLNFHTAATDGKNIFIDPEYFASLSENDKMFLIAHEIMHIKFMHVLRLVDKTGEKRNMRLWNIATDAIINANLERDGFTIKDGYVNMPEALGYSAEEFYQILLERENEQKSEESQNGQNGQNGQNEQNDSNESNGEKNQNSQSGSNSQNDQNNQSDQKSNDNKNIEQESSTDSSQMQGDDHTLWEEAFEKQKNNSDSKNKENDSNENKNSNRNDENSENTQEQFDSNQPPISFDENAEFEDNRKEKREKFQKRSKQAESQIRGEQSSGEIELGNVGESENSIDWKILIRREIEKSETIWSQRRSIAENNYAYRLEENDIEDEAETEVMIDVSGSVDLNLVKAFLRELKPLLKQSKLRVGCFNEKFWGMVDVKSVRDIDNFSIPSAARGHSAWTEDWDLAVRSFTKKREINKIIFTDGWPQPGTMPKEDLKNENVIWIVYGNKEFKPCCGKVINLSKKQLARMNQIYDMSNEHER